jgi:hypothetical protein
VSSHSKKVSYFGRIEENGKNIRVEIWDTVSRVLILLQIAVWPAVMGTLNDLPTLLRLFHMFWSGVLPTSAPAFLHLRSFLFSREEKAVPWRN